VAGEAMRSEADYPAYTPRWVHKFILRLAQLEHGKAHDITLILPDGDAEPTWAIKGSAKVENAR
jgi:hypothetical protein